MRGEVVVGAGEGGAKLVHLILGVGWVAAAGNHHVLFIRDVPARSSLSPFVRPL